MRKIANAAGFVLRAVVFAPDMPSNSRNWPSLAVASRGQRSRLQHWTAPIIGNHLTLDPLVMRRSGVRFPKAAPLPTRLNASPARFTEGLRGAIRGANRYSVTVASGSRGRSRTRGGSRSCLADRFE